MRPAILLLAAGLLAYLPPMAHADDSISLVDNADFKMGSQRWHGDGHVVYLNRDNIECSEDDPNAIPVMKIALEKYQAHAVYQELNTKPVLSRVQARMEVYASDDFQRIGTSDSVAVNSGMLTKHDFLIRVNPDFLETALDLTPDKWTTVNATFELLHAADERGIYFLVPPGKGVIYIRKLSVTP